MLSIFLCHALEDASIAGDLAGFLERGTGARIYLDEGRIDPGADLIAKVDEGRTADVVLALLSESSSPKRWPLEDWQDAFRRKPAAEDVAVATVLLNRCRYPELLRRGNWFEPGDPPLATFREIKRWVLSLHAPAERVFVPAPSPYPVPESQLERLAEALADRPGCLTLADAGYALTFASRHAPDFEAVLWAAAGGSETALAGELAAQAGIPGNRPAADVLESLRRLCAAHRFLVLLDSTPGDSLGLHQPGGLTSVLAINRAPVPLPAGVSPDESRIAAALETCGGSPEAALVFATAGLDPERGQAALQALESRGLALRPDARFSRWLGLCAAGGDPQLAARHAGLAACGSDLHTARHAFRRTRDVEAGRRAASLANCTGRLAEALEIFEALHEHAENTADDELLQYAIREQCRILDLWEMFEESARLRRTAGAYCGTQQSLF